MVLIDKPAGCTSHDVVNRWRQLAHTRRVGHLGTLDPMATGLLVLVTGTATRLAQFFGKEGKTYRAEITFGYVSDSFDAEGEVIATQRPLPQAADLEAALGCFRGKQWQKPPAVSAKKVAGVPAYKLVRKQIAVDLPEVEVEISRLSLQSFDGMKCTIEVACSAGTYIRSLAHDLGGKLGCGAILSALRRTQVGDLRVDNAFTLEELQHSAAGGKLAQVVRPSRDLLPQFPSVYVDAMVEAHIRQGRDFRASPFVVPRGAPLVKAVNQAGELIAIGQLVIPTVYHPGTVL